MTLPSVTRADGAEQPQQQQQQQPKMRPTARMVTRRKAHILSSIKWSRSLEDDLVGCGLLADNEQSLDETGKTVQVLDEIIERRSADGLNQLLHLLEIHNNQELASSLKEDMQTQTDPVVEDTEAKSELEGARKEFQSLKKQLEDTEQQAKQWQLKAQKLETEKASLEHRLHTEFSSQEQSVAIGQLQSQKDLLKTELRQREKGLQQWKKKEQEYKSEIGQLRQRMDEMSGMLRLRDSELEKLKNRESKSRERGESREEPGLSRRRRGLTEPAKPVVKLVPTDKKASTMPLKLPVLTDPNTNLNKTDVNFSKYVLLPSIDNEKKAEKTITQTTGPSVVDVSNDDPGTLSCMLKEKWIDRSGGDIELPNVTLHIPPNSVSVPVLVSVTETEFAHLRQQQIEAVGLTSHFQPGMQLRLQPHGQRFLRPIFLEMKNVKMEGPVRMLVFHKEVEPHMDHPWTDITNECAPKTFKDNVILAIDRFSIVETIKLLVPVVSLAAGMAIGYKMHACALFNNRVAACNFYVYYKSPDPYLVVLLEGQHEENNNPSGQMGHDSSYKFMGYGSSRYPLCDKENLLFYYNASPNLAGAYPFDVDKCAKGQKFHVPVPSGEGLPKAVYVRRRVASVVSEEELCNITLGLTPCPPPRETTWEKVLRLNRMDLIKDLNIQNILPRLRQDNVININEEQELLAIPVKQTQAGRLLDIIVTKGPAVSNTFLESLEEDYKFLADKLRTAYILKTSSSSIISSSSSLIPHPPNKRPMKEDMQIGLAT